MLMSLYTRDGHPYVQPSLVTPYTKELGIYMPYCTLLKSHKVGDFFVKSQCHYVATLQYSHSLVVESRSLQVAAHIWGGVTTPLWYR